MIRNDNDNDKKRHARMSQILHVQRLKTAMKTARRNEIVPEIITNDTIKFIFLIKLQSLFVTSNRNGFRVTFEKIPSVYFT